MTQHGGFLPVAARSRSLLHVPDMLDLRGIETFWWVATLGGFRAAAEKLHTSRPAVSQRIQQLEQALDVRLFDRDTRGVRLTVRGQLLLEQAGRMLELRQDMLRIARDDRAVSGRITLGVAETIAQTWLPDLLSRAHEIFPDLVIDISVETTPVLRSQLLAHQIDLAILLAPVAEPQVGLLPLCRVPLAWVASPSLRLGTEPVTLQRVAQHPVITYASGTQPYVAVKRMLSGVRGKAPQMYGCASLSAAARMVQDGIGIGVIAPAVLQRELGSGALRIVDVSSDPLPELSFCAAWLRDADSQVPAAIARIAADVAAEGDR